MLPTVHAVPMGAEQPVEIEADEMPPMLLATNEARWTTASDTAIAAVADLRRLIAEHAPKDKKGKQKLASIH